jgi:hypothetical protein
MLTRRYLEIVLVHEKDSAPRFTLKAEEKQP